jgi:hypothetical protein
LGRGKSTDGDIDALGVLITAVYGLDHSWFEDGSCFEWPETPSPWQYDPGQPHHLFIRSDEMVAFALIHCQACPVQYRCAAYAVEGRMIAGTWGMAEDDLRWLQRQGDWRDVLAMGQAAKEPVQRVVVTVRAARSTDP